MEERQIVGIGNAELQQKFIQDNKRYLDEWQYLQKLIAKVFLNRTINPPSEETRLRLADLPDDHPDVLKVLDKYNSDIIVYTLGRIAIDDLSELVVLGGNGWGFGALKILRGMYERIVTSAYIAKTPQASRPFADSFWIHRLKLWNRLVRFDPAIAERSVGDVVETVKSQGEKALERKSASVCKHCGQIKTVDAWTPLDLASMARIAGRNLEDLYTFCYLDPTSHIHATGAGVTARAKHMEGAWLYNTDSSAETQMALHLGHNLTLQNLQIQNDYFGLEVEEDISERVEAFGQIWETQRN